MYFLWKLFDFSFFVDAHRLLKFYKFFVIRHRNKLTSTYNYQARQLTLQANDFFLFFHLNESEKERKANAEKCKRRYCFEIILAD